MHRPSRRDFLKTSVAATVLGGTWRRDTGAGSREANGNRLGATRKIERPSHTAWHSAPALTAVAFSGNSGRSSSPRSCATPMIAGSGFSGWWMHIAACRRCWRPLSRASRATRTNL